MIPTTNGHLKNPHEIDLVKLIGQHLTNLGLKQTVESLLRETGLASFDQPSAVKFQHVILSGEWDHAKELLDELIGQCSSIDKISISTDMKLLIAEQKFLELIDDNKSLEAVKCLRLELTPGYISKNNIERIKHLASLLFCKSTDEFKGKADWPGKGSRSRQNLLNQLQKFSPPLIMMPPNRLLTLISQAIQLQKSRCSLHREYCNGDFGADIDLNHDHVCPTDKFPINCRQVFDAHKGQIWYCQFSNDGLKLATGGHGGIVKIWDVDPRKHKLNLRCKLDNHCYSVNCLSWSSRDEYLIVCLSDSKSGMNLWHIDREVLQKSITLQDDHSANTCSWHPKDSYFAVASIMGNFNIFDLDGNICGTREGIRVQCLSFLHKDEKHLLAADNLHRIRPYKISDMMNKQSIGDYESDNNTIRERHPIMSFVIDNEDQFLAVNLYEQGVHLWDYKTKTMLKVFSHSRQTNYIIHSSFSGKGTLLSTGSEDGRVYIYHVQKDEPVAILHGHSRCVNCVSWNPKYPDMLASVGDDRLIHLWGPPIMNNKY